MFKSIYKMLAEDFAFLCNYEYFFLHNLKHYVHPSIEFKRNESRIQIGYRYDNNQIYVHLYDATKKKYPNKEELEKIEPKKRYLFSNGIDQCTNLLEAVTLIGSSYKDQVKQVKEILLNHLQE